MSDEARRPLHEASEEEKAAYTASVREKTERKGLVIVNTGDGKGKTTAAFGVAFRAAGRGMRVGIIQFLKHDGANFGELRAARQLGITVVGAGDGFTWTSKDLDESERGTNHGVSREFIGTDPGSSSAVPRPVTPRRGETPRVGYVTVTTRSCTGPRATQDSGWE